MRQNGVKMESPWRQQKDSKMVAKKGNKSVTKVVQKTAPPGETNRNKKLTKS